MERLTKITIKYFLPKNPTNFRFQNFGKKEGWKKGAGFN